MGENNIKFNRGGRSVISALLFYQFKIVKDTNNWKTKNVISNIIIFCIIAWMNNVLIDKAIEIYYLHYIYNYSVLVRTNKCRTICKIDHASYINTIIYLEVGFESTPSTLLNQKVQSKEAAWVGTSSITHSCPLGKYIPVRGSGIHQPPPSSLRCRRSSSASLLVDFTSYGLANPLMHHNPDLHIYIY